LNGLTREKEEEDTSISASFCKWLNHEFLHLAYQPVADEASKYRLVGGVVYFF